MWTQTRCVSVVPLLECSRVALWKCKGWLEWEWSAPPYVEIGVHANYSWKVTAWFGHMGRYRLKFLNLISATKPKQQGCEKQKFIQRCRPLIWSVFTVSRCGQLTFHELLPLLSSLSRPPTGSATTNELIIYLHVLYSKRRSQTPQGHSDVRAHICHVNITLAPELCRVNPNRDHNNYTFNYFWANANLYSLGAWVCTMFGKQTGLGVRRGSKPLCGPVVSSPRCLSWINRGLDRRWAFGHLCNRHAADSTAWVWTELPVWWIRLFRQNFFSSSDSNMKYF